MILKDKDQLPKNSNKRLLAGDHQEKNVAFYLRRAFKDRDDVLVINDLRIVHNGETAQIDHLVITELGFCLVESKSIKATVKINKEGEWTRVYAGNLKGIPSPIKQVELKEKLLRDLLAENKPKILGKVLGMQQGFGGRKWATVCAISSDAVIDRKYLPKELNERVMKSEFITDWVDKNVAMKQGVGKKLMAFKASAPLFSQSELETIGEFLLSQHTPVKTQESNQKESSAGLSKEAVVKVPPEPESNTYASAAPLCCKQCKSSDKLTGMYGKYGYYAKCGCGVNSSMKRDCPKCDSAMRIKKDKARYSASCECGEDFLIFEDSAPLSSK